MLQVSQNYKSGNIALEEVDPPALKSGGVLVRSAFSVISLGTEGMKLREAKMNLVQKAKARPDQVKKVLETVQQQGLSATYNKVMNRLDSLTPLGYSLSGIVETVGKGAEEFEVGQRIACAGAGLANHAELNYVPRNLVVPVPESVSMEHAAFATIGAIALHGFRQGDMRLGETACVIGLGLVGQVLAQILTAAGMRVIGIDPSAERCKTAEECGVARAFSPESDEAASYLERITQGHGADCVFLTASTGSNGPLEQAIDFCRDRGRIVAVGKTSLDLPYVDMFTKEIDLKFSRSYGPGRYDTNYEDKGIDYPIGYVRWTERRNLAAFLDLVAQGKINLNPIITDTFPFSEAVPIYEKLHSGDIGGLGILFSYDTNKPLTPRPKAVPATPKPLTGSVRVGVIGAGNYASSMLLPHVQTHDKAELIAVATGTALSGANAARKFGFERHGTDYKAILAADDINAVIIATRHASHARMTAEALQAGKTVFVEKPLAIDEEGLKQVQDVMDSSGNTRLQVGFNRRFSPIIQDMERAFAERSGPLALHYRVHAGQLDSKAWQCDPSEGSRFIGEAGHFFDVFDFIIKHHPVSVMSYALRPQQPSSDDLGNMTVLTRYADGSVATLQYLTQGGAKLPKEFLEISGNGKTLQMHNFEQLKIYSAKSAESGKKYRSDKGQKEEIAAFLNAAHNGKIMPIAIESLINTTSLTLAADQSLRSGMPVQLS